MAFEQLVERHERDVVAICRSVLRDDALSRDAAQETFLRLWRRLGAPGGSPHAAASRVEDPERLGGWLRRVALTSALDLARRRPRVGAREVTTLLPEHEAGLHAPESPPGRALEAAELARRYETALGELSEGQRTVFLLRHERGLSLAEVAATLGVAPATAKTQFARACVRLQARLRAFAPERPSSPTKDER